MNKKVKDNPAIYMYWDQKRNVLDPKKISSNSLKYAYWSCPYCQHHWEAKIIDVQLDSYEYLRCCPHCGLRIVTESIHVLYLKKQIGLVHFVQIEKNFRILIH